MLPGAIRLFDSTGFIASKQEATWLPQPRREHDTAQFPPSQPAENCPVDEPVVARLGFVLRLKVAPNRDFQQRDCQELIGP